MFGVVLYELFILSGDKIEYLAGFIHCVQAVLAAHDHRAHLGGRWRVDDHVEGISEDCFAMVLFIPVLLMLVNRIPFVIHRFLSIERGMRLRIVHGQPGSLNLFEKPLVVRKMRMIKLWKTSIKA
jgi:hypothetical protein